MKSAIIYWESNSKSGHAIARGPENQTWHELIMVFTKQNPGYVITGFVKLDGI